MDISFYLRKRNCRIAVPHGAQRTIAERFGVTKQLVSYALKQERNSKRARDIRKVAMEEFGGREEKKTPSALERHLPLYGEKSHAGCKETRNKANYNINI